MIAQTAYFTPLNQDLPSRQAITEKKERKKERIENRVPRRKKTIQGTLSYLITLNRHVRFYTGSKQDRGGERKEKEKERKRGGTLCVRERGVKIPSLVFDLDETIIYI